MALKDVRLTKSLRWVWDTYCILSPAVLLWAFAARCETLLTLLYGPHSGLLLLSMMPVLVWLVHEASPGDEGSVRDLPAVAALSTLATVLFIYVPEPVASIAFGYELVGHAVLLVVFYAFALKLNIARRG